MFGGEVLEPGHGLGREVAHLEGRVLLGAGRELGIRAHRSECATSRLPRRIGIMKALVRADPVHPVRPVLGNPATALDFLSETRVRLGVVPVVNQPAAQLLHRDMGCALQQQMRRFDRFDHQARPQVREQL